MYVYCRAAAHKLSKTLSETILHNDRGSQYNTDMAFEIYLNGYGIQQDLGGTSRCYGRQRTDGKLLSLLKKEKPYKDDVYKLTRKEVTTMIFCYVFVYYNRIRVYTTNPYGLPHEIPGVENGNHAHFSAFRYAPL